MKKVVVLLFCLLTILGVWFYVKDHALFFSAPLFTKLKDIKKYAKQMDEYPPIDNTTWANPDFSSFLRKQVPTNWQTFLHNAGLKKWPLWHIQGFKDLLIKVTNERENNGEMGRFVLKMKPSAGSRFVIWGDVQGAFHSQVRVLNELYNSDVINQELEIIKPYVYFVFNGDLINRSAYSLEALTLTLRLMENNPDNVFYIRGNHEDREYWKNFGLKRDLIIRAARVSDQEVPLNTEIDRFFNTLPLALYLIGDTDENNIDVLRISHYGREAVELEEETFSGFFKDAELKKPSLFKLTNKIVPLDKKINVRAIIKGESRSTTYRPTPGLTQLETDKGATAWSILSSPTESYRHLQDFYYDAFAVLAIRESFDDWSITLYNQDVRELLGFKRVDTYNVLTGLRVLEPDDALSIKEETFIQLQKRLKDSEQQIETLKNECPVSQIEQEKLSNP